MQRALPSSIFPVREPNRTKEKDRNKKTFPPSRVKDVAEKRVKLVSLRPPAPLSPAFFHVPVIPIQAHPIQFHPIPSSPIQTLALEKRSDMRSFTVVVKVTMATRSLYRGQTLRQACPPRGT